MHVLLPNFGKIVFVVKILRPRNVIEQLEKAKIGLPGLEKVEIIHILREKHLNIIRNSRRRRKQVYGTSLLDSF